MLQPKTRLMTGALILALLSVGLSGGAMIPRTLRELVRASDVIVRAQVKEMTCRWGYSQLCPGKKVILTDVLLQVQDSLYGQPGGPEITVEIEGGAIGELGLWVEDMPHFSINEDVILLCGPANEQARRPVTGLVQGKFTVVSGQVLEARMSLNRFLSWLNQTIRESRGQR